MKLFTDEMFGFFMLSYINSWKTKFKKNRQRTAKSQKTLQNNNTTQDVDPYRLAYINKWNYTKYFFSN